MSAAIESLNYCVKLLKMVKKAKTEISEKRYYRALRTIDEIQGNQLRNAQDFKFAQSIKDRLPIMKQDVKRLVLKEMKDWLSKVREDSKVVGSLAIQLGVARQDRLRNKAEELQRKSSYATNSVLELLVNEELECRFKIITRKLTQSHR